MKKTKIIQVRVTSEDHQTLSQAATKDRRSLSEYLLVSGLNGVGELK